MKIDKGSSGAITGATIHDINGLGVYVADTSNVTVGGAGPLGNTLWNCGYYKTAGRAAAAESAFRTVYPPGPRTAPGIRLLGTASAIATRAFISTPLQPPTPSAARSLPIMPQPISLLMGLEITRTSTP
jgi:hypothetical protein